MDKSIKYGLILSLVFLLIISFFAFELPYLQHILNLNLYLTISLSIALILTYLIVRKTHVSDILKERIAFVGLIFVLQFLFWLCLPSLINRSTVIGEEQKLNVNKIKLEWSSMFGMMAEERSHLKPTHVRLNFDHNGRAYERAFKKEDLRIVQSDENDVYIFVAQGLLGFDYILK